LKKGLAPMPPKKIPLKEGACVQRLKGLEIPTASSSGFATVCPIGVVP
jgi:hypothetical protein